MTLQDFFKLNGPFQEWRDEAAFRTYLAENTEVSGWQFTPETLKRYRNFRSIKDVTFRNVGFSKTVVDGLVFRRCRFEDCLFIATTFKDCEFHNCVFLNTNLYKARFQNTYVDPRSFKKALLPKQHANIGVSLFQELARNSAACAQHSFQSSAEFLFRKWKRYQLRYRREQQEITWAGSCVRNIWNLGLELTTGYGWRADRLAATIVVVFLCTFIYNLVTWSGQGIVATNGKTDAGLTAVNALYYTSEMMTTLGTGDLVATKTIGLLSSIVESVLGIILFAMIASLFFRKAVRA